MCLEKNDVKPIGDIFYKVFAEKDGKLYWLIRDEKGERSFGEEPLKGNKFKSTKYGFCVWEKRESAVLFKKLAPKLLSKGETIKFNIKKVRCSNHIQSGTCIASTEDNTWEILVDNKCIRKQAFTFKNIEVL